MDGKKAFEKFYQTHIDKVYRFVYFRTTDKELAQDLVSEIFMKALEHFDSYDKKISSSAWIMTITKNHLANHWRDAKPIRSIEAAQDEENGAGDALWVGPSLGRWLVDRDKAEVYELLAKIGPEEAEIVTLHYLIGYSYNEIASMKDKTEGALKVVAHRAIKKMREML